MKIRIGSRASKLALIQAEMVEKAIKAADPSIETTIVAKKTTGDRILDRPLDQVGGKGLFVKELDRALMDGEIDISVHSLKDVPMELCGGTEIVAVSKREMPHDALVLPAGAAAPDLAKPIGCGSRRRVIQLRGLFPGASFVPIRGNVQTRLAKVDGGELAATVLAEAGLFRLGLHDRISRLFTPLEMIPAACQGIVAVQAKTGFEAGCLRLFADGTVMQVARAERAFVRALDGGCTSPTAAYATVSGGEMTVRGFFADDSDVSHRATVSGRADEAEKLGEELAGIIKKECGI